jgi:hypothetical protein
MDGRTAREEIGKRKTREGDKLNKDLWRVRRENEECRAIQKEGQKTKRQREGKKEWRN